MGQSSSSLRTFCRVNAFACMVLGYVLFVFLGGLVFSAIEMPVEKILRAEVGELRRSFLQENPCVRESRLNELLGKALAAEDKYVAVLKADGEERHYDFTSSLYFVIVTLTTMGYDLFTPISDGAKLFCIFYCTLGIPLTLFLLTLLSDLLLPVATHAPVHHLQTHWGLPYARAPLVHACLLWVLVVVLLFLLPALVFRLVEPEWSFLDALFFCFVTLSTIGQGGYSLGRTWDQAAKETLKLLTTCYLLVGLVVIMTFRDTVLEVPQVQALIRLFSGPRDRELEGVHLDELVLSGRKSEEEPRYSLPISTITSSPIEPTLPSPDLHTTRPSSPKAPTVTAASTSDLESRSSKPSPKPIVPQLPVSTDN
ncbi:potassium channel, subfamily K, member 7 [Centroberyx gerrardi]|uniref:potassium channel, subfamily K, member 7 n=1 Tax=Centroberyx gerrardi TaxID=166262 RepID=UPI003AAA4597